MSDTRIPSVGIIMGSQSDWPTMEKSAQVLEKFGVEWGGKNRKCTSNTRFAVLNMQSQLRVAV